MCWDEFIVFAVNYNKLHQLHQICDLVTSFLKLINTSETILWCYTSRSPSVTLEGLLCIARPMCGRKQHRKQGSLWLIPEVSVYCMAFCFLSLVGELKILFEAEDVKLSFSLFCSLHQFDIVVSLLYLIKRNDNKQCSVFTRSKVEVGIFRFCLFLSFAIFGVSLTGFFRSLYW